MEWVGREWKARGGEKWWSFVWSEGGAERQVGVGGGLRVPNACLCYCVLDLVCVGGGGGGGVGELGRGGGGVV